MPIELVAKASKAGGEWALVPGVGSSGPSSTFCVDNYFVPTGEYIAEAYNFVLAAATDVVIMPAISV